MSDCHVGVLNTTTRCNNILTFTFFFWLDLHRFILIWFIVFNVNKEKVLKMGENAVAAKIDEHLTKVQNVIKASLDEFEESGQKIDRKFIKHFEKVTKDR